jgi:ribulose-5-phosphate 4-epimerase/fuculose-1-phosphate aldolase
VVPVGSDGGNQRPEAVVEVFKDARVRACLLEKHGSVAVGDSLLKAQHVAELVEETAQIAAVGLMIGPAEA